MTTTLNLTGVPETMLWTLHNRAGESMRKDPILRDPEAERIRNSIDYDYERSFGPPNDSHALRSWYFDQELLPWMAANPGGQVVELGCGLETQFQRIDDGRVRWLCVDVPEAIKTRERFLRPTERCRHLPLSALDRAWMDEVDSAKGVFISAQGLFMYFPEDEVHRLLIDIAERFPGAEIMFDAIPPWFSAKTLKGFNITPHYQTPPMPWGIKRSDLPRTLANWDPRLKVVSLRSYGIRRGFQGVVMEVFAALPGLRNLIPLIAHIKVERGKE